MVSVLCLIPSGQTVLGQLLFSLAAFNSQLTALIATAPCSLWTQGPIHHLSQTFTAKVEIQLLTVGAVWTAPSFSAQVRRSSPQHRGCQPNSVCVLSLSSNTDRVSTRYCSLTLTKSLVRSKEILSIKILAHAKAQPCSKTSHHHAGAPRMIMRGFTPTWQPGHRILNTNYCIWS